MTPAANVAGLSWAWFDEAQPHLFTAPKATGNAGAIVSGVLSVTITGTALASGGVGWLEVDATDGNPASNFSGWGGPLARA